MSDHPHNISPVTSSPPDVSTAAFTHVIANPFTFDFKAPSLAATAPAFNPFAAPSTLSQETRDDSSDATAAEATRMATAATSTPGLPWAQFASLFNALQPVLGLTPQPILPVAIAQPPPSSPELASQTFSFGLTVAPCLDIKPIDFAAPPQEAPAVAVLDQTLTVPLSSAEDDLPSAAYPVAAEWFRNAGTASTGAGRNEGRK